MISQLSLLAISSNSIFSIFSLRIDCLIQIEILRCAVTTVTFCQSMHNAFSMLLHLFVNLIFFESILNKLKRFSRNMNHENAVTESWEDIDETEVSVV